MKNILPIFLVIIGALFLYLSRRGDVPYFKKYTDPTQYISQIDSLQKQKEEYAAYMDSLQKANNALKVQVIELENTDPTVKYITLYKADSRVTKKLETLSDSLRKVSKELLQEKLEKLNNETLSLDAEELQKQIAKRDSIIQELAEDLAINYISLPYSTNFKDEWASLDLTIHPDSLQFDLGVKEKLLISHELKKGNMFRPRTHSLTAISYNPYVINKEVTSYSFKERRKPFSLSIYGGYGGTYLREPIKNFNGEYVRITDGIQLGLGLSYKLINF